MEDMHTIQSEDPKNILIEAEYVLQNGVKSPLINNEDENFSVALRNDYIDFDVSTNFFISRLHFVVAHVDAARFSLEIKDLASDRYIQINNNQGGDDVERLTFEIGRIIRSFRLHYDKRFLDWTKPFLHAISIEGIPLSMVEPYYHFLVDIENAEAVFRQKQDSEKKQFDSEKRKFLEEKAAFEQKVPETEARIAAETAKLQALQKATLEAEKKKEAAVHAHEMESAKLEEINAKLAASQANYAQAEASVAQKKNEHSDLSKDVATLQTNLREMKRTFATYSNELASFNKLSNWYIGFYAILLVIPVAVLAFVLLKVFDGSIDLTTLYKRENNPDITTIFMTRLPFVAVAGFLIYGAYGIFKLIAMKIMDTQSEKLALLKISIIAQDVVNLSNDGLDLTPEQIQDANIYLRMELIKAYMKNTIGKDFEYRVRDGAILDSIKEHIIARLMPQSWADILKGTGKSNDDSFKE